MYLLYRHLWSAGWWLTLGGPAIWNFWPSYFQKSHPTPTTNNEVNQEIYEILISGVAFSSGGYIARILMIFTSQNTQRKNLGQTAEMHELPLTSYHSRLTPNITGKEQPKDEVTLGQPQQKKHTSFHHDQVSPLTALTNFTKSRMPLSFNEPPEQMITNQTWSIQGLIYLSRIFAYIFISFMSNNKNRPTDSVVENPHFWPRKLWETSRFALKLPPASPVGNGDWKGSKALPPARIHKVWSRHPNTHLHRKANLALMSTN